MDLRSETADRYLLIVTETAKLLCILNITSVVLLLMICDTSYQSIKEIGSVCVFVI